MPPSLRQLLQSLAAAKHLKSFATAGKALQGSKDLRFGTLNLSLPSVGTSSTFAWANGLKLLSADVSGRGGLVLDAPAAVLRVITTLCMYTIVWLHETVAHKQHLESIPPGQLHPQTVAARVVAGLHTAHQLTKAGVLQALADFCSAAAADLHRRRAQQQQPVILPEHAVELLDTLLCMWVELQSWWPGKTLVGSHGLVITVKPVVTLAAAVMTSNVKVTAEQRADRGSRTKAAGGDSRSSSRAAEICLKASARACQLGFELLQVIKTEGFSADVIPPVPVPCVKELVATDDILLLAAAMIGSWTSWLWQQQQQQQQQRAPPPEPHHARLLQRLGCPELEFEFPSERVSCEQMITTTSTTRRLLEESVKVMQQQQQHPPTAAGTSNVSDVSSSHSNSSNNGCRILPVTELALTLFELLVLLPPDLEYMMVIRETIHDTVRYMVTAANANSNSSSSKSDCGLLLEPLLLYMGPAVTRLLQTAGERQEPPQEGPSRTDATAAAEATAGATVSTTSSHHQLRQELWAGHGLLLLSIMSADAYEWAPAHLAAAILKQPQTATSSLSMGMRALAVEVAAPTERGRFLTPKDHSCVFASHIMQVAMALLNASYSSDGVGVSATAGASLPATSPPQAAELASPQVQQELLSMLLCCAKVAALTIHKLDPDVIHAMCLASAAVAAASASLGWLCLPSIQQPMANVPSNSSSSSSSAHNKPWLLLCGRVLNILGAAAHRLAADPHWLATTVCSSSTEGGDWRILQDFLQDALHASQNQRCLLSAAEAAAVLLVDPTIGQGAPADTAAAAAHTRILLQQQDALILALETSVQDFNELCTVMAKSSSGSASIEEATVGAQVLLPRLGKQLQETGAAVCAALPVPYCCNNPGCCSFRGESEQQLVSGKGCVCGGCQVARYCGKDCQTAHWPQHKAVCKRIKKQRAAAAT